MDPNGPKYQYLIKKKKKKLVLNTINTERLLLKIQKTCRQFIKILKNTTKIANAKY